MYNSSLEQFYRRIARKIALVGGYTEDKALSHVIRSCRLKPVTAFSDTFELDSSLERIWVDEFDNTVEIVKKKAKIKLHAVQQQLLTTDIFRNETIQFVKNHSKYAYAGLMPESTNCILLLMGTDNYLRCYLCVDNKIELCSPLVVGLKVLRRAATNKYGKHFTKLTIKSEMPNFKQAVWFSFALPASKLLLPNIMEYKQLRSILYNE